MDYRFVENFKDRLEQALRLRGDSFDLAQVDQLGLARRTLQGEHDQKKARLNELSGQIGKIFKEKKDPSQAETLKKESSQLKSAIQEVSARLEESENKLNKLLLLMPNVLHESVAEGKSDKDNPVVRSWGEPPTFSFDPKDHETLGRDLGILDLERAAEVSGARFSFLRGAGVRLERALVNFMLDLHAGKGYEEMSPPLLVSRASMTGTGQLPKFADDAFRTEDPELYLIPTAEVPVANYFRNEILDEADLPKSYVAYSPCFRREAGSYGKDTKGLIRQHQFYKVELVKYTTPEQSYEALEQLTADAETVLQKLELPYRVVSLCSGDIGFAAAKTYDLEVWLPSQKKYREISSCSNCEEFQARRANIRYRQAGGKKIHHVHTLNGSGLAVGRTWLAVLENHQQKDGSIKIPEALVPYMGGMKILSIK